MKPGSLAILYGTLSFLLLRMKLALTASWFDGTLEREHALLVKCEYTNNEQSRLLAFGLPELLHAVFGASVSHAYVIQRFVFVGASLVAFHLYLRAWFDDALAIAAAAVASLIAAFTFRNDLQESSPLLMLTFVLSLWAIRERRAPQAALVLFLGTLNNETTLVVAPLVALHEWSENGRRALPALARATAVSAPGFVALAAIRYVTRDRPHLGGAWHWPDNWAGIAGQITASPLDWARAPYLHFVLMFGALWYAALSGLKEKPAFVARSLVLVPLMIAPHLLTGIIGEPRQMIPLAFVLVPSALMSLVPEKPEADGAVVRAWK